MEVPSWSQWLKKKGEDNNRREDERLSTDEEHGDRYNPKRVDPPYADSPESLGDVEKEESSSFFSEDSLSEEDIEEINNDEIYVVNTDLTTNVDDGIRTELETLKLNVGGISDKLDSVIKAIENMTRLNPNGTRMSEAIMSRLNTLTDQQKTLDNQQEIIKRQHDAMLKYSDDVIYKTQKGLILEMISFADQVRMIMENKREDESYDLMQGLIELEESIEASLSNNSVRRYSETENDDTVLNRRRQTAIGNDITSDPTKDGHFKSVAPGYEWTMPYLVVNSEVKLGKILEDNQRPQTFSFVIRPEEVMKLKYRIPKQDFNPNHLIGDDEGNDNTEDRCI